MPRVWFADGMLQSPGGYVASLLDADEMWCDTAGRHYREIRLVERPPHTETP